MVEVLGPEPPGSRRPTDRALMYQPCGLDAPRSVGFCFKADGRVPRFLVDQTTAGEQFLAKLGKFPKIPARPVKSYGVNAWLLQE